MKNTASSWELQQRYIIFAKIEWTDMTLARAFVVHMTTYYYILYLKDPPIF